MKAIHRISKIFLYPIAWLYGLATLFRNWLYDTGYWQSVRFDLPVIGVGNLTMGGTGKTPHIEYLIFLLQYLNRVATLSRGYGRETVGFAVAQLNSTAAEVGDEPLLFKLKYPDTYVTVGEDRLLAIPHLLDVFPDTEVILMDDGFQHRSVHPGLSILLTEYAHRFTQDELLPVGWLREAKSNYHRADIIVVTKCPSDLSLQEQAKIREEIKPYQYQKIHFSTLQYGQAYLLMDSKVKLEIAPDMNVLLVCGIAKYQDLKDYLLSLTEHVYLRHFRDHHAYDPFDMDSIRQTFENLGDVKKVIVTTEKDAMRLLIFRDWFLRNKIEIFVQPIRVVMLGDSRRNFDQDILRYVEITKNKIHG